MTLPALFGLTSVFLCRGGQCCMGSPVPYGVDAAEHARGARGARELEPQLGCLQALDVDEVDAVGTVDLNGQIVERVPVRPSQVDLGRDRPDRIGRGPFEMAPHGHRTLALDVDLIADQIVVEITSGVPILKCKVCVASPGSAHYLTDHPTTS